MKAALDRFLCRHPQLYLRVLRATGRGSIEKRVFLALIRSGDVVFDIGANRGHFTRLFSRLVGEGGAVHAFEPVPATFESLRAGAPANVSLNACALGDTEGAATLHLPGDDDGQASLRTHTEGSWAGAASVREHTCPITTLDKYAATMSRIDFVKCDVEGAELLVIRGGRATLTRLAPMLWLEVNADWTRAFGYTPPDLLAELRTIGYDTFRPDDANLLCAISARHASRLAAIDA